MNALQTLKSTLLAALAAGAMTAPLVTHAALVTQLIHFDDASNGWSWYSDVDNNFLFDPVNLQSGHCADSTSGGNGSCVIEGKQGVLPKMTRPTTGPQSQGSPNRAPQVSGAELFTLDAFYFLLNGNGTGSENAITVTGGNGVGGIGTIDFYPTYTFQLGSNWDDDDGTPDVTFYKGDDAGKPAGDLLKQVGYIVSLADLFEDVTWIQFSAPTSAQLRLDCIVATFDGSTTQPYSNYPQNCGTGSGGGDDDDIDTFSDGNSVPEPATLALVGLGLLGAAAARRRRSV